MTIKKQLFYSNLLMVVAPVIAFLIVGTIAGMTMNALFSDPDGMTSVDESLLEIQEVIDNSDANLLIGSGNAQNNLLGCVDTIRNAQTLFHLRIPQGAFPKEYREYFEGNQSGSPRTRSFVG